MNQSPSSKTRVAFLGLGLMGAGMARRLLLAGFPTTVYNRNRSKAEALAADGATVAGSPKEAAKGAAVIISMVSDDPVARQVWLGPDGALDGAGAGAILIESSTVSVEWIGELQKAAQARGCELIDAPVTGSRPEAAAGELRFLVGGSDAALATVQPVFAAMGKTVIHVGPSGSGARMKLINNFLAAVQIASLAEAVAMIERSGLERDKSLQVLVNGAPGSPIVKNISQRMMSHDYDPRFAVRLMAKDLGYAAREGQGHGVPMAMAKAAREVFQNAIDAGWGDKDFSSIVEPLRARKS